MTPRDAASEMLSASVERSNPHPGQRSSQEVRPVSKACSQMGQFGIRDQSQVGALA